MRLTCENCGDYSILTIHEAKLDARSAEEFTALSKEIVPTSPGPVLADLSSLVFIDSSGIGELVGLMKYLGRERRLELCGLTPVVLKLFRLTHLDTVFVIHDSVDAAKMRLSGRMTGT